MFFFQLSLSGECSRAIYTQPIFNAGALHDVERGNNSLQNTENAPKI